MDLLYLNVTVALTITGMVLGGLGIVFGGIGIGKDRLRGFAIAGLVIGIITIIVGILFIIIFVNIMTVIWLLLSIFSGIGSS